MGVVDIGSNSVRLVVYEGAVRSPTPIFNEKVLCGLGRQVGSTGRLGEESVERALEALSRFKAIARILGVKNVRAIATAACRDASNGPDFIARGERALGARIQVLSGQREAELAANGIMMGFRSPDGIAGDLGGGSLELIEVEGEALRQSATLPLGGLRLLDAVRRQDRARPSTSPTTQIAPRALARRAAAAAPSTRSAARGAPSPGCTWSETGYPLHVMHGYTMPTEEAIDFCEEIRKAKKLSAMPGIEEISRPRREVLPYGALVLERLLEAAASRARSTSPCSASARAWSTACCRRPSAARTRCSPSAPTTRACAPGPPSTPSSCAPGRTPCSSRRAPRRREEERRLRHAACLLSDISWRAHPDYRGEQSLILIAHAALGGIDHPGRVFLALAIYFRHIGIGGDAEDEGKDKLSERLKAIVSKKLYRRARIIGAAIRAAHMLSIGRPGIIDETPLAYERNKLVLTVPKAYAALDGERLRRRFAALAELLEREPEIRVRS